MGKLQDLPSMIYHSASRIFTFFIMTKLYLFLALLMGGTSFAQNATCNFPTPEDFCEIACIQCQFNGLTGSTSGFTSGFAVGFCSGIQNDQWYGFIAGQSTNVTFTLTPSNCFNGDGLQMALYSNCFSDPLACDGGGTGQGTTPTSITANLIKGQTYFLVIDGFGGDECTFQLDYTPPSALSAPTLGPVGAISGPSKICPGATILYSIAPVQGASYYKWTIPADATINGQPGPGPIAFEGADGTKVEISFGNQGGNIFVSPFNACRNGNVSVKPVTVGSIPPTVWSFQLCPSEFPYTLPNGQILPTPVFGSFSTVYVTPLGCDSMVTIRIAPKSDVQQNLGKFTLCTKDSLFICGKAFSLPGTYTAKCQTWKGCDSLISFMIERPTAEIIGGGSLNCFKGAVPLRAGNTIGTKVWKNAAGQVIATTDTLNITTAGKYTLEVTDTSDGKICIKTKDITIKDNDTLQLSIVQPITPITCAQPISAVKVTSNMPAVFNWAGAATTPAVAQVLPVSASGPFTFTASTPGGCTAMIAGTVVQDSVRPLVTIANDTLSCNKNATTLRLTTNVPLAQYRWSGPGAFSSTKADPLVSITGNYQVTVTNPSNGCSSTATVVVRDEYGPRILSAVGGTLTCAQQTLKLTLQLSSNIANPVFLWTGPNGFTSTVAEPVVSVPGNYLIMTTNPLNGCTRVSAVMVMTDNQPFTPPAGVGGTLNCRYKTVALQVPFLPANYTYQWVGPGGFISTQPMPSTTVAGTYVVTVTNPANGCKGTTTAVVNTDLTVPAAQAVGGTLSCSPAAYTLNCTTNAPLATFLWSGPNGFSSNLQNPIVNQSGIYRVTVTNSSSACTTSVRTSVNENPGAPYANLSISVVVGNVRRINCTTTAFNPTFSWSGPNGFTAAIRSPVVVLPGMYTVRIKDSFTGCETYRSITVPNLTTNFEGVKERSQFFTKENTWQVYPNPAGIEVWLSHEGTEPLLETRVQLLDATGRLIWEITTADESVLEVNVANIPPGLYRVLFITDQGIETKPLVVQR